MELANRQSKHEDIICTNIPLHSIYLNAAGKYLLSGPLCCCVDSCSPLHRSGPFQSRRQIPEQISFRI